MTALPLKKHNVRCYIEDTSSYGALCSLSSSSSRLDALHKPATLAASSSCAMYPERFVTLQIMNATLGFMNQAKADIHDERILGITMDVNN